jgi:ABC-type transport system involved in multi-copper enzyme maturation permease subunit
MLNTLRKMIIVAQYTFKEVYRSKIMMNVVLLGLSMAVVSYGAAEFTYGVPGKVSLDFGLGVLTLSCVGIAIFMGSTLISKEVESRTIYMALSRPISRSSFLIGRVLGMIWFLLLNSLLLGGIVIALFCYFGGEVESLIVWTILYIFIESVMTLLIVVNFSMVTNPVMSVVYTICIYATGHALPKTLELRLVETNPILENFISLYGTIFPNFHKLNIRSFVLYEQFLPSQYLVQSFLYGLCYSLFLLVISVFLFKRRNLD